MPKNDSKHTLTPGQRFERLTVLGIDTKSGDGRLRWICQCDCGETRTLRATVLMSGRIKSCGCRRIEVIGILRRTHGQTRTPEWRSWRSMRGRCLNPRDRAFPDYGARGITICKEWDSFEQFYADMGDRPSSGHSLGRIDNDAGYSPSNCRWENRIQQNRNTRRNRKYAFDGRTLTTAEWSEEMGVPYHVLHDRLTNGWPIERALTQPVRVTPDR